MTASRLLLVLLTIGLAATPVQAAGEWPQWRGPLGTGVAPGADPPIEWREDHNVRWKIALPGRGHSTPVVWGDRLFLTSAIPTGETVEVRHDSAHGAHDSVPVSRRQQLVVLAFDRRDGRALWQRVLAEVLPHEGGHTTGSYASGSPVTDGEMLIAFFGSNGLFGLSLDGELRWQVDVGSMSTKHAHGEGSSPALHGDTVVVNWDHEGESFVVAFDRETGAQRWKVPRDEATSWATPIVVEDGGRPQAIVAGTTRVRGYDLATGRTIWECGGLSHNVVASPVSAGGVVYVGSSYDTRAMMAIRFASASGDITGSERVLWSRSRGTPYVPSPLLYDDALYFLQHYQGVLTRLEAKTGRDAPGAMRLPAIGNVYSSPVGAANRVYITDRSGATVVLRHGDGEPRVLAINQLDDRFNASTVAVGDALYLRGERSLYAIAEPEKPTTDR